MRANLARMRCLGRIRANHSKNCNEEMLGEAQPQPVAHQCARDGGSDNENREGHLRQLPPLRERDHPATDLSDRLDYPRNQAVVFSVEILRRSQILAYPMRSLRLRAFLSNGYYSNPCILLYRPHDKPMTSASDDGLEVHAETLRRREQEGGLGGGRGPPEPPRAGGGAAAPPGGAFPRQARGAAWCG